MKEVLTVSILVLLVMVFGHFNEDAEAVLVGNQVYLVEGAGFAVTDESIKNSQIDLLIATQNKVGSRTPITIEDGFVTLNNLDFDASNLSGNIIMNGRFLVITGTATGTIGNDVRVSLTGKLIQNSDEGSVYSFTGRITQGAETNKIIYTTKISELPASLLSSTETTSGAQTMKENEVIVHIMKHSANPNELEYIDQGNLLRRNYYSLDRITIEPGTTITWINDDVASHSISSGTGLGSNTRASQGAVKICDESQLQTFETDSGFSFKSPVDPVTRKGTGCTFTMDGRIKSGEILPGESWSFTIEEPGFYRLADVDYIWMNIVVYAFPDVGSTVLPSIEAHPLN